MHDDIGLHSRFGKRDVFDAIEKIRKPKSIQDVTAEDVRKHRKQRIKELKESIGRQAKALERLKAELADWENME